MRRSPCLAQDASSGQSSELKGARVAGDEVGEFVGVDVVGLTV